LHQHIFKVGWLITGNMHTTTILYYTFFLPGIILYEVVFWLVAGILNVRAERTIEWPEEQEIAELDLKFVEIPSNVHPLKMSIIHIAPTIVGLLAIALIANNILGVEQFFDTISTGQLTDVSRGVSDLTSTTDFWLWIYLAFTISNTMLPDFKKLAGFRIVGIFLIAIAVVLFLIGIGNQTIGRALRGPVADGLNTLSGIILIIISINIFAVVVLGFIEASIERVTGKSAIFRRGKMITMTRQEVLAQKEQARQREARRASAAAARAESGPPSIYKMNLPIPGAPGDEPVARPTEVIMPEKPAEIAPPSPRGRQERPTTIEAPSQKATDTPERPETGKIAPPSRPQLPRRERPVATDDTSSDAEQSRPSVRPGIDDTPAPPRPRLPSHERPAAQQSRDETPRRMPSPPRPPSIRPGSQPTPRPQTSRITPSNDDVDESRLPRPTLPGGNRRTAPSQNQPSSRPVPRPRPSQKTDIESDAPLPRPATPKGIRRTATPQNIAAQRGRPVPRPRPQLPREQNQDDDDTGDDKLVYEDIEDEVYEDDDDVT